MISWVYGLVIWFFYFAISTDEIADFLRLFWAVILQELAVDFWVNIQESTSKHRRENWTILPESRLLAEIQTACFLNRVLHRRVDFYVC